MNTDLELTLQHLKALVACDTSNPPRKINQSGLIEYLNSLDFIDPQISDLGKGSINIMLTKGSPRYLINVHLDTVPAGDLFRIETSSIQKLLTSLDKDKRYSEFIILSPFTKDGIEFSRILFLDGDYVKRNEKYLLGFDSLATITYNRGVITLIGDEMWRVQQVASRTSAKIGQSGLNILNMDAQEETSRIIIVVEDSDDNIRKAISAIHQEISEINFI